MSSPSNDDMIFKALASPIRRELLDALRNHPQTTGELCAQFSDFNRCTVMQHLGVLEECGLVLVKRTGRHRWNYLNAIPIKRIHDRWIGAYAENAVLIMDRIKNDLESTRAPVSGRKG